MIRFSILLALITTMRCCAQLPEPDSTLWNGGAINPSGEFAVPVFAYNPGTGVMSVDTRGVDGVRTTTEPDQIAGDDVGLITLTIEGPADWQVMDVSGFMPNPNVGGAVIWGSPFFITKPHLFGVGAGAEYLEPGVWDIFQFDSGLTSSDFGRVEVAVNFASGMPGATIFGSVQLVPEPSGLALSIFPGVLLLLARRKSERHGASRRYGDASNRRLAPSRSQQNELFIPMEQLG